mmetsp:Transcript_8575/g.16165  ORF Transcript_8575/g.16165 Transcript_8575/m.16165 type:complete len:123 (-) Transcript_8575:37-405(-)
MKSLLKDDLVGSTHSMKSLLKDIPTTNRLKDMSMEERISEMSSKQNLEEAFAQMTYHSCHLHDTSSPQLGKVHNTHMAETNGTHRIANEYRANSLSTCATSPSAIQQDCSSKQNKILASHVL